jgi:hypothetical protein
MTTPNVTRSRPFNHALTAGASHLPHERLTKSPIGGHGASEALADRKGPREDTRRRATSPSRIRSYQLVFAVIALFAPGCDAGRLVAVAETENCALTGTCLLVRNCAIAGDTCSAGANCCSGACAANGQVDLAGTSVKTCQNLTGCRSLGETCKQNDQCCSKFCQTADPADVDTYLRCQPGSSVCLQPGEYCGEQAVASGQQCCETGSTTEEKWTMDPCQESSSAVFRCRNIDPTGPSCKIFPEACASASECCPAADGSGARYCLPTDTGTTRCSPSCAPLGQHCEAAADCCFDQIPVDCRNGTCTPTGLSCNQLGQRCSNPLECCNHSCRPPLFGGGPPLSPTFCAAD